MIRVTKNEAIHLRKMIPGVHITRTTHKWYAEETKRVLTQLPDNAEAVDSLRELEKFFRKNYGSIDTYRTM